MKNLCQALRAVKLSSSAKESLTFLIILFSVYSVLILCFSLVFGTLDLGFAYVGFFVISGLISVGATPSKS